MTNALSWRTMNAKNIENKLKLGMSETH